MDTFLLTSESNQFDRSSRWEHTHDPVTISLEALFRHEASAHQSDVAVLMAGTAEAAHTATTAFDLEAETWDTADLPTALTSTLASVDSDCHSD